MRGIRTAISIVDQMTAPIMSITHAVSSLCAGFADVEAASNINTSSLDAMKRQVEMTDIVAGQLEQQFALIQEQVEKGSAGQQKFNEHIERGSSSAGGLMNKIGGIVAAYASIRALKSVFDLSDELTQTTARLNIMNDGLQTTKELQDMIFKAAERSRGSYQNTHGRTESLLSRQPAAG